MDVPLATVMYCPVPSQELDDAFRPSHSADPSPKLLKCRDEPLALPGWCSLPPQSWMVLQGIQLWSVFYSVNPNSGIGPAHSSFTGSVGRGAVVEILMLSA